MKDFERNIHSTICENSKARHDYFIEETYEAGICLTGTEVKSLRFNQISIAESHVLEENAELFLHGSFIPEYEKARIKNHYPRRPRKMLLHSKQIKRLMGLILRKGYTIIPLKMYFNNKNKAKVLLGVGKGKKAHDKRETIKDRDWDRKKSRIMKMKF